jgi:hypothetical protein
MTRSKTAAKATHGAPAPNAEPAPSGKIAYMDI